MGKTNRTLEQNIKQASKDIYAYARELQKLKGEIEKTKEKLTEQCGFCGVDVNAFLSMNLSQIQVACEGIASLHQKRKLIETALEYCRLMKRVSELETEVKSFQEKLHPMTTAAREQVVEKYGETAALLVEAVAEATKPLTCDDVVAQFEGGQA